MAKGKGRGGPRGDYYKKVLGMYPSNLFCLYRMNERSGTALSDWSNGANHGTYGSVALVNDRGPDRHWCAHFDGTASYADIYSTGFNTDFSEAAGTIAGWAKVNTAAVWADATKRRIITIAADADNYACIDKSATTNRVDFFYVGGGTSDSVTSTILAATGDWFHVAVTVSVAGDLLTAYINGASVGTATTLGTWAGALSSTATVLGSSSTTAADVWSGWLSNIAVWNNVLSADEIKDLANLYG